MIIAEHAMSAWNGRSERERVLLLAMGAILAGLFLWCGIAAPLRDVADGASADLRRAAGIQDIVQSAAALDLSGDATVEEILAGAAPEGLTVERHSVAPGEITVWARAPNAAALFGWLGSLQQRFGVAVANLSVAQNNENTLEVEIVLAGGGT